MLGSIRNKNFFITTHNFSTTYIGAHVRRAHQLLVLNVHLTIVKNQVLIVIGINIPSDEMYMKIIEIYINDIISSVFCWCYFWNNGGDWFLRVQCSFDSPRRKDWKHHFLLLHNRTQSIEVMEKMQAMTAAAKSIDNHNKIYLSNEQNEQLLFINDWT